MSTTAAETVAGRVRKLTLAGGVAATYRVADPGFRGPRRVIVAVHGTGGSGGELIAQLREVNAAVLGRDTLLLCPSFETPYQYLCPRADEDLLAMCRVLGERFELVDPLQLFGFSGGAQFVHRFAARHPARVGACVAFAAGCWTNPDGEPHGMQVDEDWFAQEPWNDPRVLAAAREPVTDREAYRRIRWCVGVGDRDHFARQRSAAVFHRALLDFDCEARWVSWAGAHDLPSGRPLRDAMAFLGQGEPVTAHAGSFGETL